MAVYQGSLTVKRRPKDGVPGNPGIPGLPGQVPIQKEWVVGDTHRFNDEIKDFIYVRGASQNNSYWYTRTSKGDDIVAGAAPVGGVNVEGYTKVDWMPNLAAKVLLAEEANLANFIFKDEKLISVRGTVNGVEANYSGQANFKPYIILDGKTGKIYAEGAEISGVINALSGSIGGLTIADGKLYVGNVGGNRFELNPYDRRIRLINNASQLIGEIAFSSGDPQYDIGAMIEMNHFYQGVKRSSVRLGGVMSDVTIRTYDTSGVKTGETNYRHDGVYINGQKVDMGGGSGYVLPVATQSTLGGIKVGSRLTISSGVLSANVQSDNNFTSAYKNKLDGIATGANNYTHPSTHPASMITEGTFPGIVKANNNTSYTTKQVRNIILSTGDAVSSQMANGDIWIKYE